MRLARSDVDALARGQRKFIPRDFDRKSSPQHIKKLAGFLMVVANFGSARRHPLFDDA